MNNTLIHDIQLWVTIIICLTIIIVAIFKRDKNLVTLLWIAGTFTWILLWLKWIDAENILESVPVLLWWLWTAFITSIAWILASILISFFESDDSSKDQTDFLKDIKKSIDEWNKDNKSLLEEIKRLNDNIWWEWDTSIVTQIQKLRTDTNDNHKEFIKSFDDFAEKVAKANTEELINSIQKVMEDFNSKINDQLWESFKELTTAIDNLLKWQEEYKENITTSTEALNKSAESLEKSSKWFEITVEESKNFVGISEKLWDEMKSLNGWLEILREWINEFDWIAKNTKEMSDSMIKSIETLTDNFVSKATTIVEKSEQHISSIKSILENQTEDLSTYHKNLLDTLKQNIEENNRRIWEQLANVWNTLEEQVTKLDDELWQALNKSLSSFGQEITTIANAFADELEKLHSILSKE